MPVDLGEDASFLNRLRKKARFVFIAFVVFTIIIVGRLWFLQVLRADYYTELCEQNNVRYLIGPRRPGDIGMSIADVSKAQTLLSL